MFKKALRTQKKLKILLMGVSGSGKTRSALHIAKGIGGRIAVLDTECNSASLYAGSAWAPEFDTAQILAPYTVEKYLNCINEAIKQNYDTLIIDSGSHQWAGEGGLLQEKEKLDASNSKDTFRNWAKMTPKHEKFKNAILYSDINIIMTLRSKQEYAIIIKEDNKKEIKKLALAPIQRDGLEYDFDVAFDIDSSHYAVVSKNRTELFDDTPFLIDDETGIMLKDWINKGAPTNKEPQKEPSPIAEKPKTLFDETLERISKISDINILQSSKSWISSNDRFTDDQKNKLYTKCDEKEIDLKNIEIKFNNNIQKELNNLKEDIKY